MAANVFARRAQFMQHQLEPQLGRLMGDQEQHFVVIRRARLLSAQDFIQMQVVPISHRAIWHEKYFRLKLSRMQVVRCIRAN